MPRGLGGYSIYLGVWLSLCGVVIFCCALYGVGRNVRGFILVCLSLQYFLGVPPPVLWGSDRTDEIEED